MLFSVSFHIFQSYFTQHFYLSFYRFSHLNIPLKIFPSKSQMWEKKKKKHKDVYLIASELFTFLSVLSWSFTFFFQIPSFDANPLPSQDPLQPLQQDQPTQTSQVLIHLYIYIINSIDLSLLAVVLQINAHIENELIWMSSNVTYGEIVWN